MQDWDSRLAKTRDQNTWTAGTEEIEPASFEVENKKN
jgi:hypothetical protein